MPDLKKILFVTSTYPRNHDDTAVPWMREHVRRLSASGYDVTVFAPSFRGLKSHVIDGIEVVRFRYCPARFEDLTHDSGAPNKLKGFRYIALSGAYVVAGSLSLARLHWNRRFEILHVHWPFPHAAFSTVATWLRHARVVLNFHGAELLLANKYAFVNPFLKRACRKADAVVCNSSFTAAKVKAIAHVDPLIVPYGSPMPERDVCKTPGERRRILFVGRLIERKGVEYLIRAMPLVQATVPADLIIVGSGQLLDSLRQQVFDMKLQNTVSFLVDLPEERLVHEYERADVFVLPAIVDSRGDTEGLGVVLIEALSFDCPVVASGVGGIVDVIRDGETGLLVPEKNPAAIASAIIRVLKDPAEAAALAAAGKQLVRTEFSWESVVQRTAYAYRKADQAAPASLAPSPVADPE